MIDVQTIKSLSGAKDDVAALWQPYLNDMLPKRGINTKERLVAFLSQVGHESGGLFYTEEIASGAAYEGRKDLGNTQAGDGVRFKGRGVIQTTGRANYEAYKKKHGIDVISNPSLLGGKNAKVSTPEQLRNSLTSALDYWESRKLNQYADKLDLQKPITDPANLDTIKTITKKINGGYNGLADRIRKAENGRSFIKDVAFFFDKITKGGVTAVANYGEKHPLRLSFVGFFVGTMIAAVGTYLFINRKTIFK
jgi:putative chitinase